MTSYTTDANATMQERDHGQLLKNVKTSAKECLGNAEGITPIWGDGPNNAGPANERRPLLGDTSITNHLRTLGAVRCASEDSATASLKPGISEHGSTTKGTRETRTTAQLSRPHHSHINLDVDNHSYSRDAVENCITRRIDPKLERQRSSSRSPDEYRRSLKPSLNRVPEEMEASPSEGGVEFPSVENHIPQNNLHAPRFYGSVGYGGSPHNLSASPRYVEALLDEDTSELSEEDEEWLLDEELAKRGLYRGNYKILVLMYTLVPLSTILAFLFLALLPSFAFPTSKPSEFPYPPYFPFPLPELLTATALWALSYLLRDFLHSTSVSGTSIVPSTSHRFPALIPVLTSLLSSLLQGVSSLFFRLIAIPILLIPYYSTEHVRVDGFLEDQSFFNMHKQHFPTWHDDAFRRVWWVALGWAAAEAVVGIKQGFESISLYKDVLVTARIKEVNYMEPRRTRDEEESSPPAPGHLRSITPTQTRLSQTETSLTPTQKDQKRRPLPINPSPPVRRDLSESISSINSVRQTDAGQGQGRSSNGVGEREPLLKIDVRPDVLSRRATDEISRLSVESEVERDLDELLALKSREDLEEVYGIPVIRIPVAISCLHRINAILSSLGIYLLITSAYMRSTFAYPLSAGHAPIMTSLDIIHQDPPSNKSLAFTLPPLLLVHILLSMMHTPWVLPRIGIHTFVYVGLLISLGLFFGGLGVWEVLT